MRVWLCSIAVLAAAACSGGGGGVGREFDTDAACGLLTRLADSAESVETVDISDPAEFDEALENSVNAYVATVDDLRDVLPSTFDDDLDQLEAAASQYRFEDALEARVALDEYARANCVTDTTAP